MSLPSSSRSSMGNRPQEESRKPMMIRDEELVRGHAAQLPSAAMMLGSRPSAFGLMPGNGPIWAAVYYGLAILCNLVPWARRLVKSRPHAQPPIRAADRYVHLARARPHDTHTRRSGILDVSQRGTIR